MNTSFRKFFLFLIFTVSLAAFLPAQSITDSEEESKELKKDEWCIYYKSEKKITAGPFESVDEALEAWIKNPKIKSKSKYFIGKNGRMYTDSPETYYVRKYSAAVKRIESENLSENITNVENGNNSSSKNQKISKEDIKEEIKTETEGQNQESAEDVPLTKKELREKQKAQKKKEKEEKKAAKNKGKAETEEISIVIQDSDKTELTSEEISETESTENTEPNATEETITFTFELPLPETIKDSKNQNKSGKSYLSDFISKENFNLQDFENTELEAEFLGDPNETDYKGVSILMKSVREGNDWKIKTLLKAGADINAKDKEGWTPLMYAVRYQSNLTILNILLAEKADVKASNNYGLTPLVIASCFNDNPDVLKKLLSFYSPSDKEVQKAFVQLISTQETDTFALVSKIKIFLDFGLPVNSYYEGKTPLMYACKYCTSTKPLKLLLERNAEIQIRSTEGKTAFDYSKSNNTLPKDEIYWSLNKR